MSVNVRHLLMHERSIAGKGVLYQQFVARLIQNISDGTLAQFLRVAVLVGKIVGIINFAGTQVIHVKLPAHKGHIHLMNVAVERFVRKDSDTAYQPLGLVVHLPGNLVPELSTDKALITVLLVLVHLLPETQGARRQIMPELFAQRLNGSSHHAPIILLSH